MIKPFTAVTLKEKLDKMLASPRGGLSRLMSPSHPDPERFARKLRRCSVRSTAAMPPRFVMHSNALCAQMDSGLLPELKRITATAQSALARFSAEARLDALAGHEVPDARKRLTHVVKLTDEAAHRTMDLVDTLRSAGRRGGARLRAAARGLGFVRRSRLAIASLWPERAAMFLERTRADSEALRANLSELLMAQGYQDITGQIIRSVISLVDELEQVLGKLVRDCRRQ